MTLNSVYTKNLTRSTQAQIHKVMNIGSQVNRKAFKQLRQLEKQAKTKAS